MNTLLSSIVILSASVLWACAASPPASNSAGEPAPVPANVGDEAADATGLGPIVYSGQSMAECRRQMRTGTRIRREVCNPNAFNGLFPGGVNLGTGGESQPGYGRK